MVGDTVGQSPVWANRRDSAPEQRRWIRRCWMIGMDFWLCPARDVERRVRCGEQKASLLSLENPTRDSARRTVNPRLPRLATSA